MDFPYDLLFLYPRLFAELSKLTSIYFYIDVIEI